MRMFDISVSYTLYNQIYQMHDAVLLLSQQEDEAQMRHIIVAFSSSLASYDLQFLASFVKINAPGILPQTPLKKHADSHTVPRM